MAILEPIGADVKRAMVLSGLLFVGGVSISLSGMRVRLL
jgi:hypothetical protein